jgi:hypothetical protein
MCWYWWGVETLLNGLKTTSNERIPSYL